MGRCCGGRVGAVGSWVEAVGSLAGAGGGAGGEWAPLLEGGTINWILFGFIDLLA